MLYLLIHGSWHGAWCWQKLTPLLINSGHRVNCLELPGCGEDANNAPNIVFEDYYQAVYQTIKNSSEPLIVVAHSSAGLFTARVCEELHEHIQNVFYIAGWLPFAGKSLLDMALSYNNSQLPTIFIDCGNPKLRAVNPEGAKQVFYHDCTETEQNWASARLKPKAAQPDIEKMPPITPTHSLAKSTYIICEQDRVVNPLAQLDMANRFGFTEENIRRISTGHSPFLAKPQELVKIIGVGSPVGY
jgi:pimeloyl-ACP methyl ester carboxylesterase